jgi:protein SCO1/2
MTRSSILCPALPLVCILSGAACAPPPATSDQALATPIETAQLPNDGASLFALDITMIDQAGRPTTLRDLAGHPTVASMVYASCTSICPRVTDQMQAIERQLAAMGRSDVRFVLFSLDPSRDTPESWSRFATAHKLDLTRWRLLTPTDDGLRDLAAVLGIQYATEANGEIAHTALLVAVDPLGVVQRRQVGLGQDPRALVEAVTRTPKS